MRTVKRDIAAGVLVSKDKKIFLGRHRAGGAYEGCWIIPGGGIEEGETKEDALKREMREETGIDITGCEIELVEIAYGTTEKTLKTTRERVMVEMTFHDFRVQLEHNAEDLPAAPDDELAESHWFSESELRTITMSPPTRALFEKLS